MKRRLAPYWYCFLQACRLAVAGLCGFLACFSWQIFRDCGVEPQINKQIPSLAEVQRMVGAKSDGIYGPETREKWDRAICDQFAAEWE